MCPIFVPSNSTRLETIKNDVAMREHEEYLIEEKLD
jgi:hypothetical protein